MLQKHPKLLLCRTVSQMMQREIIRQEIGLLKDLITTDKQLKWYDHITRANNHFTTYHLR